MQNNSSCKRYDITQCALYKCRTKKRLAKLLNTDLESLKKANYIIRYHSFQIEKKHSTEKRQITVPGIELKTFQKRILFLLQKVIRPEWLISGEKGKCYIDNGKAHINGRYVVTIDIKKFYDNCSREPVYKFFIGKMKTAPDVAKILTDLATYDDGIPTGCPTSQILAFYAYYDMFSEIYDLAQSNNCVFTLYVDDMTFSSSVPFNHKVLMRKVDCILRKYGHTPKYKKTKYYTASDYKPITGTILTPQQTLTIPNGLQKKVYDDFKAIKLSISTGVLSEEEKKTVATLQGRLQAIHNIDQTKFPEISRIVRQAQSQNTVSKPKQK